jgi:hypothetical protein
MLRISGLGETDLTVDGDACVLGFIEWSEYVFHDVEHNSSFVVDDEPLIRNADGSYTWKPSFYAGRVWAEIVDENGKAEATFSLDVGPSPHKLGKPVFDKMLKELMDYRSGLALGMEAARTAFGHDGTTTSHEIKFGRLRIHGLKCVAALESIFHAPVSRLRRDRRYVRAHQAKKADIQTVKQLGRSATAQFVQGGPLDDPDIRISVPSTIPSFDNACNRAMASIAERLLHRCQELEGVYQRILLDSNHALSARAPRRLEVLAYLRCRLARIRRIPPLADVSRPEVTAAGLNAIASHPLYARGYQFAWKALRQGIEGDPGDELLPISPSWEVYERWCFVKVAEVLKSLLPDASWHEVSSGSTIDAIALVGKQGDNTIEVRLQARFPAWDKSVGRPFRSLTGERIPDVVVTLNDGQSRRLLVLDAKYRSKRHNILDAMQSAHVYRDALRWHGVEPWRVVILIPKGGEVAWLEDHAFQQENGIGVVEVKDGENLDALRHILMLFVQGK